MSLGRVPNRIADYALIGDCHTNALVGRDGSIDWLCFPRPDSPAIFCHLLDDQHGGNFAVRVSDSTVERRYVDGTNVLQTMWTSATGVVEVLDCMPVAPFDPAAPAKVSPQRGVLRRIRCLRGTATVQIRVTPRFEYALVVPRLRTPTPYVADFMGGGSALRVRTTHPLQRRDAHTLRRGDVLAADWEMDAGETAWVEATWTLAHSAPSGHPEPDADDWQRRLDDTIGFWRDWLGGLHYDGDYADSVRRSALVLKALTYSPTGAVIAAATTSLPEEIGGERNWDYRYVWIRDATLTLTSLFALGLRGEAAAFKEWLERTGAGRPQDLQIMYGVEGERLLPEVELDHLRGHRDSRPVRIGNGAVKQLQLDSFGQLLEAAYLYAKAGGEITADNRRYLEGLADICCTRWREPDQGIWEVRTEPRHFMHSKLNCWLALHRAVQLAEMWSMPVPELWVTERDAVRAYLLSAVDDCGWCPQAIGFDAADAATLLVPALGLLAANDARVQRTVETVTKELSNADGLLHRYHAVDGLAGGEGAFLLCSFWLVDVFTHAGRLDEATELLERLLGLANDVGLYAEEIDTATGEHLGNTPQAFTHMALVTSCAHLSAARRGRLPIDGAPHDFAELAVDRLIQASA
ncbi:MAG: glycoside hydrolase family 15 protein [Actinomycetes bacterium]